MADSVKDFPEPVFVGGSARSGTHAIGRLLNSHPRYHLIAVESRFHCGTGGLPDLLNGNVDLDSYCERVLGQWWQRGLQQHRGLQVIMEREELEAAINRFRADFPENPWDSGRRLVREILDPSAERAGKPAWVDLSGSNIRQAPTLLKLFPRARFIHMVRDGRAVTAAILKKRDMTDDLEQAFGHWAMRVRRSDAALRQMPPGAALTIYLDDLTAHDRDNTFARLVEYLELDDPKPMRDYFEATISPEKAHVGAWRERMAPADARWVDRRYRRLVRRLRREGIDWVPEPWQPVTEVEPGFPAPIFVGGVGRSGTHVMGRLIDAGPRYHWIPTEVRFHAWRGGLPDLVAGDTSLDDFLLKMRNRWYVRGANRRNGLKRVATPEQLEAALAEFQQAFGADPKAAGRDLIRRLLDPAAKQAGKAAWVEITGPVVEFAPFLHQLFPQAKFINMVRDGRAVVAGTLKKVDLTDDPMQALAKWEQMVSAAGAAMRALPAGRALTVQLDDLTAHDRDATFERVVEFLEIDDPAPMREYFEREISAERAHVGAWRQRMAPADARRVDRRYRRMLRKLRREGVDWAPAPR